MKNAILLHGTGATPGAFWFPSIIRFLQARGYEAWAPQLPEGDAPALERQLPFILKSGKISGDTVFIGHSSGCPLALAAIEESGIKARKAILIAGYARKIKTAPQAIVKDDYDWEKIRRSCGEFIIINSDDDPWGCDDKEGRFMFDHLGGTLIIRHGEGHMGSEKFHQPYREFPLLERLLI